MWWPLLIGQRNRCTASPHLEHQATNVKPLTLLFSLTMGSLIASRTPAFAMSQLHPYALSTKSPVFITYPLNHTSSRGHGRGLDRTDSP